MKRKLKNVLVTGGAGFIGSNFIHYIYKEASFTGKIINVDKLTYAGNLENLEEIENKYDRDRYFFEKVDICDYKQMKKVFENYDIDTIVNFAAESHVDRSIYGPKSFVQTNIMGTFNLLEVARECWKMKCSEEILFHHISTDEVYGSIEKGDYFYECTAYKPNSPYSASKASSDHLVRAYYKTYGLPVTISNCSNNYGPYQFPEKLIPLMILNGIKGKPLPIYGDGKNIRDWLYVEDHCEAIQLVLEHGRVGETYNIGGSCEKTNIELVEIICSLLDQLYPDSPQNPHASLITYVKDRPGHDRRYAIDSTKIKRELGWEPKETFDSGLKKTIMWYIENFKWVELIQTGAYREWIKRNYDER